MNILRELHEVASKFAPHENRPTCSWCGQGKLDLIDERPDPNFGALGMSTRTLRCDSPTCGKLTTV
jgi:hypothetical protein